MSSRIAAVRARQILDSRGNPTVEVEVELDSGELRPAAVPSGASTGQFEAVELRDGDERLAARASARRSKRRTARSRRRVRPRRGGPERAGHRADRLDGTENKARLGANAILGCSLATAKAGAARGRRAALPLDRRRGGARAAGPMLNVVNGGAHAHNSIDLQEFMIVPAGAESSRRGCGSPSRSSTR